MRLKYQPPEEMRDLPPQVRRCLEIMWLEIAKTVNYNDDGSNLPEYADNTAALAAGMQAGALYRAGDSVNVVHD